MANWKEQIEAEKKRLADAKAALTKDDLDEIAGRAEVDKIRDERKVEERKASELNLARRLDAAEARDPGASLATVAIDGWADTFIVEHNGQAHARWEKAISAASTNKHAKVDAEKVARDYCAATIVDWNGLTDFDEMLPFAPDHRPILKSGPLTAEGGGEGATYVGVKGSKPSTGSSELLLFLAANPGLTTPIVNTAARLAGFFAEERKS